MTDEDQMNGARYASPYDMPRYMPQPKYTPKPFYPAAYSNAAPPAYPHPQPVQCPQQLLIGCAPQVQYAACSSS